MDLIEFSIGCRHCRETDGKRWQFQYQDEEGQLPLAGRADFGLMRMVEVMAQDLGQVCPFCGSAELEIFDMELNGQLVFNFDQMSERVIAQGLAVCALDFSRDISQPGVQLHVGPPAAPHAFLVMALDEMAARVRERPAYDFAAEAGGTFYFCVVGRWDADPQKRWLAPQKYTCRGLSREEVLGIIQSVRGQLGAG